MTSSSSLANPRRTTLASLAKGSELAPCSSVECQNVAVRVVQTSNGRQLLCRTCGDA